MNAPEPATVAAAADAQRRLLRRFLIGIVLISGSVALLTRLPAEDGAERFNTFVTLFLGIFIEAAPFLLAGAVVSGFIEVFVNRDTLARLIPRRPVPAALVGTLLGIAFPVCECGVVPVTRRLYSKGMPLSVGVAFLLAAPVVNPIVFFSTLAAFGNGSILWWRFGLSIAIPFVIGLLFLLARPESILRPQTQASVRATLLTVHELPAASSAPPTISTRVLRALGIAGDDFLDMGRYLVMGSLLAAGMQTLVPRTTLLALGENTLTAVITLMILAFVLSVCSTVDAFLALSFVGTFPPAAILAFLVFGPMVDIKSALMFSGVFRRRVVGYLILLPLLITLVTALFLHLQVGLGF